MIAFGFLKPDTFIIVISLPAEGFLTIATYSAPAESAGPQIKALTATNTSAFSKQKLIAAHHFAADPLSTTKSCTFMNKSS